MIKVTKCPQPLLLFNDNVPEKLAISVSKSPPTKSDKNNFKIPPPPVLRPTQKHSVFEYIDAHASSKIGQRSERMSEVAKDIFVPHCSSSIQVDPNSFLYAINVLQIPTFIFINRKWR